MTIGATSGILTFNTTPDFETKSTYSITITATDDGTPPMTDTQAVAVTVTNVEEGVGMVAISGTAQVGMVLTAGTVTGDPDVVASVDSHEWQSAPDGTTTYAAYNPAATGSTYTPGVDDVGRSIRVVATYTDGHGGGKKVASAATAAVKAAASADATLSGLVVTGNNNVVYDLNEAITSTRTDYTANVPNGVRSVRLTLTSTHANAVVRIGSTVITRGGDTASITLPAGGNQGRAIDVTAEAGGAARRYNLSIIRAANTAPTITAGNEAIMHDENTREVATYAATDDEGNTIAWSHGGTDASLFTIDATSGVLTFNAPLPNYELPTDASNDRVYDITVTATDNGTPNEASTLAVTVTVTDVEETGTIGRITGTAQVGVELTAGKVTDPDAVTPTNLTGAVAVADITYEWQSAADGTTAFGVITGAPTTSTYTPEVAVEGRIIRVEATYTDGFGSDTAISAATDAVRAAAVVTPIAPPAVYTLNDEPHATDGDKVVITFTSSHTDDFTIEFDRGSTKDFSIDDAATPYIHTETVGYDYDGNVRIFLGLGEVAKLPVTTGSEPNAPSVTVVRNPNNSIEVSWDNIPGVDFTIYAVTTGANDVEIIDLVTSPHTIATTDPLFDTVNNADGIGVRGFAEGNPVGDHSAPITSDEVPDEAPAVTDTTPPTVTLGTITEGVIGTAQDYDITFSEAVTGLAVGDFSVSNTIVPSGDLVVNSVTDSGDHTTYTISITPRATAFTLTLDANSVTDLAATPNMGPATAASASGSATAAPAPTNTAPVVSGNAAPNYAENAGEAETYTATDAEDNAIAWSVTGTDASFFAIDADGALTFSTSPDFEDAHGATYSITITATETNGDPSDLTGELAVTVTVTNVDEPGAIGDITGTAQVGVELTAGSVTDPDGAVTGVTYQWQSSPSDSGDYTNISGADQGTYTLVKGDEGRTIQVIATYTDPQGGNKKATTAPTTAVKAAGVTPPPPAPTDNTAPVLTYDRFTHTGGVVDGVITRLNAGDRLTVFVNSDEPLADSSLMDAAIFILDDAKRPAQALLRAGVTNQYRATYTIKAADHGKGLQCSVSGVMDAAGNRAADFTSPSLPVSIDTEPPVITLIGASPVLVAHGGDYTDDGVSGVNTGAGETLATVITGPDAMTVTAVDTAAGDYTYTYTATDRAGNVSTPVTRTVTVSAANTPPVAHAGGDQAVDTGASVTLNGTASSDPDGDDAALRYAWSQTDTGAPRVSLSGADTATPSFTAPSLLSADAELVFRLTVSDGSLSATDTVTITVTRPRDTVAPVITLLGDSPLDVNQGATYTDPSATASDDTDGDLSAGIVVGGDTVDTDTIGAYNVTYDVSDAAGNAAATVTRIVRVVVARDLAALNEAILPEVARDIADRNVSAIARRIEQARLSSRVGSSASLGGASSLAEIATSQGSTVADGRFDLKRLLNNSNFVLPLSATGAGAADGTQLTLWGAGDYRDLKGADGVRWSGDLLSLQLGLDAHLNERTILGVSVSKSQVELNYTNPGPAAGGNYDLDMTSVHPYLGWTAGGLDFWATLGYGEGELEISADISGNNAQTDIPSSDLSMQTLGLGANGVLLATGTTTLLLKTEALSTQLEVDASEGITAITQQAHRMRMTLEAIRGHSLDSGARLETSLEAGLRYDGGDGTTGAGAELGGGLRYANLGGGLVIEGKARALVGGKGDTEEWGLSGLITYNPAANGRGLSFSLTPGYGVTASGVERLWQQGLDDSLEAQGGNDGYNYTPNLNLRLDYGMDVSAMPGLVTPYTEFSFGATGDTYRLGLQWQRSKWFDLKLVAEREAGQITADHRIYIEGEMAF